MYWKDMTLKKLKSLCNVIIVMPKMNMKVNLFYVKLLFIHCQISSINISKWVCGLGGFLQMWISFLQGYETVYFLSQAGHLYIYEKQIF